MRAPRATARYRGHPGGSRRANQGDRGAHARPRRREPGRRTRPPARARPRARAARVRVPALVEALARRLSAAGATATSRLTKAAGDAKAHVAGLSTDAADRLVIVGGDGTLHEAVNGRPPPLPWPVAIVPVGTANL